MKAALPPEQLVAAVTQRILTAGRCPSASAVYMTIDSIDDGAGNWRVVTACDPLSAQAAEVRLAASEVAAEHSLCWPPIETEWL